MVIGAVLEKDRKKAVGIDDPEKQEHTGAEHRDHRSRKTLHDEPGEQKAKDDQTDDRLVRLNIFVDDMKNEVEHESGTAFNIAHRFGETGTEIGDSFIGIGSAGRL